MFTNPDTLEIRAKTKFQNTVQLEQKRALDRN